jgi:hypothetical protein
MVNDIKGSLNMCNPLPQLGSACYTSGNICVASISASPVSTDYGGRYWYIATAGKLGYEQCKAGTCKKNDPTPNHPTGYFCLNLAGTIEVGDCYEYKREACVCEITLQHVICKS